MTFTPRSLYRLIAATVWPALLIAGCYWPGCLRSTANTESKVAANMVLASIPGEGSDIVLSAWNSTEQIQTTLVAKSTITGKCVHCNKAMTFTADRASAGCSVCLCSHTFAECLTGKGGKKTAWRDMLAALPPDTGLRIEFNNPEKPAEGVMLLSVDLRSVLLPLVKPLRVSDADFLAIVKPIGVLSVERAGGDRMLRLALKDDWTRDRAHRLARILADRGIVLNISIADTAKP